MVVLTSLLGWGVLPVMGASAALGGLLYSGVQLATDPRTYGAIQLAQHQAEGEERVEAALEKYRLLFELLEDIGDGALLASLDRLHSSMRALFMLARSNREVELAGVAGTVEDVLSRLHRVSAPFGGAGKGYARESDMSQLRLFFETDAAAIEELAQDLRDDRVMELRGHMAQMMAERPELQVREALRAEEAERKAASGDDTGQIDWGEDPQ